MVSKPKLPSSTPNRVAGPACNTAKFVRVCFVLLFYLLCVSRRAVYLNHASTPQVVQLHPSDILSESPWRNPSCCFWILMSVPNWPGFHSRWLECCPLLQGEDFSTEAAALVRLSIWSPHVSNGLPGQRLLTPISAGTNPPLAVCSHLGSIIQPFLLPKLAGPISRFTLFHEAPNP